MLLRCGRERERDFIRIIIIIIINFITLFQPTPRHKRFDGITYIDCGGGFSAIEVRMKLKTMGRKKRERERERDQ